VAVAATKLSGRLRSAASNLAMSTAPHRGVKLKVRLIHDLEEKIVCSTSDSDGIALVKSIFLIVLMDLQQRDGDTLIRR